MPSPAPSVHLFPPTHLLCNHGYRVRGACVECGGAGALGGVVAAAQLWPHAAQTHCRTAAARCVAMFVTWFLRVPCSSACSFACSKNKRLTKGRKGQKKKMYVPCGRVRWRSSAGTRRSAACVHNTPWPCARLSLQHRRSVACCACVCVGVVVASVAPALTRALRLLRRSRSVDPFTRKEWYDIKAPAMFINRICGKTPVNRTQGTSTLRARSSLLSLSCFPCGGPVVLLRLFPPQWLLLSRWQWLQLQQSDEPVLVAWVWRVFVASVCSFAAWCALLRQQRSRPML